MFSAPKGTCCTITTPCPYFDALLAWAREHHERRVNVAVIERPFDFCGVIFVRVGVSIYEFAGTGPTYYRARQDAAYRATAELVQLELMDFTQAGPHWPSLARRQ